MKLAGAIGTTAVAATLLVSVAGVRTAAHENKQEFLMVRAAKPVASKCLPAATATVTIKPRGSVEQMDVNVAGLPPKTEFDFFVIQKPGAPFGLAWYQGDIETMRAARAISASSAASTKRLSSSRRAVCRRPSCTVARFPTRPPIR